MLPLHGDPRTVNYTFMTEVKCTLRFQQDLDVGGGSDAEIDASKKLYDEIIKQDDLPLKVIHKDGSHYQAIAKADGTIVRASSTKY